MNVEPRCRSEPPPALTFRFSARLCMLCISVSAQVIRKIVEEHEKKVEEGEAVGALPLVSSAALAAERRETKRESSKRESDVAGAAQQGAGSPAYLEGTVSRRSAFQHTTLFDGSAVGALRSSTSDAPR